MSLEYRMALAISSCSGGDGQVLSRNCFGKLTVRVDLLVVSQRERDDLKLFHTTPSKVLSRVFLSLFRNIPPTDNPRFGAAVEASYPSDPISSRPLLACKAKEIVPSEKIYGDILIVVSRVLRPPESRLGRQKPLAPKLD